MVTRRGFFAVLLAIFIKPKRQDLFFNDGIILLDCKRDYTWDRISF